MTSHGRLLCTLTLSLGLFGGSHLAHGGDTRKAYNPTAGLTFEGTPGALHRASADTVDACRDACNATGGCKGFSFDGDDESCTISLGYTRFARSGTSTLHIASPLTTAAIGKLKDFRATSYKHFDGPGHDLASYTNVPAESMCRTMCAANDDCVAYTWRDSDDRCWLKDRVPALRQRGGLVTAYKTWNEPNTAGFVDFSKVSVGGSPFRTETIPLQKKLRRECARRCRVNATCKVATVSAQGRKCEMRSSFAVASVTTTSMTSADTLVVPLDFRQNRRYRALKAGEQACYDQPGADLESVQAESVRLCRASCAVTDGCAAFTWNWKSKTCFMKSESSVPKKNAGSCGSTTAWTAGYPI